MLHKYCLFLTCFLALLSAAFEYDPDEQFFTRQEQILFSQPVNLHLDIALHSGRPFQLPGLRYHYQDLGGAWRRHRFRMSHFQFGSKLYSETTVTLQYGYRIHYPAILFLSLQEYNLWIKGYGQAGAHGLSLSFAYRYRSTLSWQFSLRNFNQPRIGRSRERLPVVARLESYWQPLTFLAGHIRWNQDISRSGSPLETILWLTYSPWAILHFTAGYGSEPTRLVSSVSFSRYDFSFVYEVIYYHDLARLSTRAGIHLALDRPRLFRRTK